jgi:hypothetical protein
MLEGQMVFHELMRKDMADEIVIRIRKQLHIDASTLADLQCNRD